jgi:2-polyprenyl-6-methoxyphenol hydroxylase-like FAD-dependent oxidoreductase
LISIVRYYVPSETGSLQPEDCQFIWVWYSMLEEDSAEFRETFTDLEGKRHFSTIPRGKMQPHIWAKRQALGQDLSPSFVELLENTTDPFVSAIRERGATQSVFHGGKLLLVGDAFALGRPHIAMSTNRAARQALGLVEVLQGKSTLEQWEESAVKYATATSALSIGYGEYCFTGKVPTSLSSLIQPERQSKA